MFTKSNNTYSHSLRLELDRLPDGEYSIIKYSPSRNRDQNALYWVLLTWVEKETWNSVEYLHEMMKKKFLSKKKLVKIGNKRNFVSKVWSTTKLKKEQFSDYYRKVETFFLENWVPPLPPHDSLEF